LYSRAGVRGKYRGKEEGEKGEGKGVTHSYCKKNEWGTNILRGINLEHGCWYSFLRIKECLTPSPSPDGKTPSGEGSKIKDWVVKMQREEENAIRDSLSAR
jgi:hypothetical protein